MTADKTEAYLAALPAAQRAALEKLRGQILRIAPSAEPHFGYGLPGFTLRGHPFIYFGATKAHCAIYGSVNPAIAAKLGGFGLSKGAIRFVPTAPLPPALVKLVVQDRADENRRKWGDEPKQAAAKKTVAKQTAAKKTVAKRAVSKKAATRKAVAESPAASGGASVDAFLAALDHPQRALVAAIRDDLRRAGPALEERVKWNAPSTHVGKVDFSAFNLRAKGFVQLILLFPDGVIGEDTGILEGHWADRRFVRFVDEADRRKKKSALTKIVRAWLSQRG